MGHDVFISYSSKDKLTADAVCARLEESRIRAWIAPRDVPAGSNFAEAIINAIDECKVFVLIWSANTNASDHILTELNQAFDQGITIIPFRIQEVQPTTAMRYYIGRTHWLDAMTPPLKRHIDTLRDTISAILGARLPQERPAAQPGQPRSAQAFPGTQKEPAIVKNEELQNLEPPTQPKSRQALNKKDQPARKAPANLFKGILAAAGGLIIITLAAYLLPGLLKKDPSANLAQDTLIPTSTAAPASAIPPTKPGIPTTTPARTVPPTDTAIPTTASTPIPGWVNDVTKPILAFMEEQPPDFEDDFSQNDDRWSFSPAPEAQDCDHPDDAIKDISGGTMKLSIVSCRVANLSHPLFLFANYVLQLDVNFHLNNLGLEFRNFNQSPSEDGGQVGFTINSPFGQGRFQVMRTLEELYSFDLETALSILDQSKPVTLTVINQNPYFLIYRDSTLLLSYRDQVFYQGPFLMDFTVNSYDVTPPEYMMLELDNVKIWDLDRLK